MYLVMPERGSQFASTCAVDLAEVQTGLAQFVLNHTHIRVGPAG